jgi:V8-like Glu-specific endopeptidase
MKTNFFFKILNSCLVVFAALTVVACSSDIQDSVVIENPDNIIGKDIAPDYADKNNPVHSTVFLGEDKGNGISLCGGLVVGRRSILTARHCAKTAETEILVSFPKGNEPIENKASKFSRNTKRIKVLDRVYPDSVSLDDKKTYVLSERNSGDSFGLDVAVLHLEDDIPAGVPVFDISKVATDEDVKAGRLMTFGYDTRASLEVGITKGYSINLLRAVDKKVSIKEFGGIPLLKMIADRALCFDDARTIRCSNGVLKRAYGTSVNDIKLTVALENGICEGDSGSPMFVLTKNKEYKLIGVISEAFATKGWIEVRSIRCARLGAYQNINPLRLWLSEEIK